MKGCLAVAGSDGNAYEGLRPPGLWRHFAALNAIPRCSGSEGKARDYVREVAEAAGADFSVDERGNALVRVPSRRPGADGPPVAIQGHLDMVCAAALGVEHDFGTDPIVAVRDGDRISARGTTLGADNGIGVAAALALITEPDLDCGALELIFTVEEEIGLLGALHFDPSTLRARSLINLDSEDDRALTVGCAGGSEVQLEIGLEQGELAGEWREAELRVSGLGGGHSGVQIHERRANAAKLLVAALERTIAAGTDVRLIAATAGTAHNAIPSAATARIVLPASAADDVAAAVAAATAALKREWGDDEPGLAVELIPSGQAPPQAAAGAATGELLALLRALPHGVLAMSSRFEDTVATSANLALLRVEGGTAEILLSLRALAAADLTATEERVRGLAEDAGATARVEGGYPAWEPRPESPLAAAASLAYERLHGRPPAIEVVHGGLECGVLVDREPRLDALSFGPSIREPHTPQEHVFAGTVATTWALLLALV